ncbi:MAG: hypothetical protein GXP54_00425 [Deltaproteobacteria bacterium]|nr:hypothetical protein [Deltaproteobacteria bacterium]
MRLGTFLMSVAAAGLLLAAPGCGNDAKKELADVKASLGKCEGSLQAAKPALDEAKKEIADLKAKLEALSKEKEELAIKVAELQATDAAEDAAAAKKAVKKPAKKKAKPKVQRTSTGKTVPKVEKKYKGRFRKK